MTVEPGRFQGAKIALRAVRAAGMKYKNGDPAGFEKLFFGGQQEGNGIKQYIRPGAKKKVFGSLSLFGG